MKCNYEMKFSFNLGNAVAGVGALANELNSALSTCGVDEKLSIRAPFPSRMTLTSDRELADKERSLMKELVLQQMHKSFPKWDIRIVSFRRKSGNVQQSAA